MASVTRRTHSDRAARRAEMRAKMLAAIEALTEDALELMFAASRGWWQQIEHLDYPTLV